MHALSTGVQTLIASRRKSVVFVALLALFLAQAVAQFHTYKHVGDGSGAPGPAGAHSQFCPDCLSHAPLLTMAGGAGATVLFAALVVSCLVSTVAPAHASDATPLGFSARAPPLHA